MHTARKGLHNTVWFGHGRATGCGSSPLTRETMADASASTIVPLGEPGSASGAVGRQAKAAPTSLPLAACRVASRNCKRPTQLSPTYPPTADVPTSFCWPCARRDLWPSQACEDALHAVERVALDVAVVLNLDHRTITNSDQLRRYFCGYASSRLLPRSNGSGATCCTDALHLGASQLASDSRSCPSRRSHLNWPTCVGAWGHTHKCGRVFARRSVHFS